MGACGSRKIHQEESATKETGKKGGTPETYQGSKSSMGWATTKDTDYEPFKTPDLSKSITRKTPAEIRVKSDRPVRSKSRIKRVHSISHDPRCGREEIFMRAQRGSLRRNKSIAGPTKRRKRNSLTFGNAPLSSNSMRVRRRSRRLSAGNTFEDEDEEKDPIAGYLSEWLSTELTEEKHFVTILFCDIVGFTSWCQEQFGHEKTIFEMLSFWFMSLDDVLDRFPRAYKLETIGDCIVVAANVPHKCHHHADYMLDFAFGILDLVDRIRGIMRSNFKCDFRVRIGLNTGHVVAGTIRASKKRFQIFGNAINIASRMESTGVPNCIHISESTRTHIQHHKNDVIFTKRETYVKGLGDVQTYLVSRPDRNVDIGGAPSGSNSNEAPNTDGISNATAVVARASSSETEGSVVRKLSSHDRISFQNWSPMSKNADSAAHLSGRHTSRRYSISGASARPVQYAPSKAFIVDGSLATCKLLSRAVWQGTDRNVEYTTNLDTAWSMLAQSSDVKIVLVGIRLGDCWKAFEVIRSIRKLERKMVCGRKHRKIIIGLTSEEQTMRTVQSQAKFAGVDFLWPKTYFQDPQEFADSLESVVDMERSRVELRDRSRRRSGSRSPSSSREEQFRIRQRRWTVHFDEEFNHTKFGALLRAGSTEFSTQGDRNKIVPQYVSEPLASSSSNESMRRRRSRRSRRRSLAEAFGHFSGGSGTDTGSDGDVSLPVQEGVGTMATISSVGSLGGLDFIAKHLLSSGG